MLIKYYIFDNLSNRKLLIEREEEIYEEKNKKT